MTWTCYNSRMKELAVINPEGVSETEVATYKTREAARAVVVDSEGKIALLHVTNEQYYKLPGGGIDAGEDIPTALARECREEIGCDVEVIGEVGSIVEYRKIFTLKQTSYCYVAKVIGEKGAPDFTEEELAKGFEIVWLPYDKAFRAVSESNATSVEGRDYITPRDTLFLQTAQDNIQG